MNTIRNVAALAVILLIVFLPSLAFGLALQESLPAIDPAPGMTLERWLLVATIVVPVLGNFIIAQCRAEGWDKTADYLVAKFPLVMKVLASNKPKEEAARIVGEEVTKLILNPMAPVTEESPISKAAAVLTDAPPATPADPAGPQ